MFRIGGRIFADEKTEYLITKRGILVAYSDETIEAFVHTHRGLEQDTDEDETDEQDHDCHSREYRMVASIMADIDRQRQLALPLVERLFADRRDKAGKPYIRHLRYVADHSELLYGGVIGLLHDTLEDTDMEVEDLYQYGFNETVVTATQLLTHAKGTPYMHYVQEQVTASPYAVDVKLADLRHNMDRSRLTAEQQKQMAAKFLLYEQAKQYLSGRAPWIDRARVQV